MWQDSSYGGISQRPHEACAVAVASTCRKGLELLLQAGAEKDLQDRIGKTALQGAATLGHTKIVQLLLQAGADKDMRDQSGKTALMEAACNGHTEIVHLLLQAGAEKDSHDQEGRLY